MGPGGKRPGAGRRVGSKEKQTVFVTISDAKEFLTGVMMGVIVPSTAQLDAAKALVRAAPVGKKEQDAEKSKAAATGRFAPKQPPKLVVNNQ